MKSSLSIVAIALCLSAQGVQAQSVKDELRPTETVAAEQVSVKQNSAKYGVYQLNPELIAVPQALADRSNAQRDLANMTLVNRAAATDVDQIIEFRRNAVVDNLLTGETGIVTGNISLLSSPDTDLQSLLQQFNLKIVRSAAATGVYIVQPRQDVELLGLLQQIHSSGLVKTARLDILEKKYSNQ